MIKKHPSMSSRAAREALSQHSEPEFLRVFHAIETASELYDSLETLHSTPNPEITKSARALKYKSQLDKAQKAARDHAMRAADGLDALERDLRQKAESAAGLHAPIPESTLAEIRGALRGMSQKDRDQAIADAFSAGDIATIKAAIKSPSAVLTGTIEAPIETMTAELINRAAPDFNDKMQAIQHAENFLGLAVDAFVKGAEKMRDPRLEAEAVKQMEATSEAERQLERAMSGNSVGQNLNGEA